MKITQTPGVDSFWKRSDSDSDSWKIAKESAPGDSDSRNRPNPSQLHFHTQFQPSGAFQWPRRGTCGTPTCSWPHPTWGGSGSMPTAASTSTPPRDLNLPILWLPGSGTQIASLGCTHYFPALAPLGLTLGLTIDHIIINLCKIEWFPTTGNQMLSAERKQMQGAKHLRGLSQNRYISTELCHFKLIWICTWKLFMKRKLKCKLKCK